MFSTSTKTATKSEKANISDDFVPKWISILLYQDKSFFGLIYPLETPYISSDRFLNSYRLIIEPFVSLDLDKIAVISVYDEQFEENKRIYTRSERERKILIKKAERFL